MSEYLAKSRKCK